jgi:glycosyltransferase involved in cell wall biosynthesis
MKYLYINTHFAPDYEFGGVVESSHKIYKYVRRIIPFFVVAVSQNPKSVNKFLGKGGKCFQSLFFHRFGFSISLIFPLWNLIRSSDLIVINGIFTFPVTLAQIICVLQSKPFVVSIRGGLEPWRLSHKRLRKLIFNRLFTFRLLRKAARIHVTSEQEYSHLNALGFENLCLVQNGIDSEFFEHYSPTGRVFFENKLFVFLFLSRTDREKGLDILISAYRRFLSEFPNRDYLLAIIGPDHQGYLKDLNLDFESLNIFRSAGVYGSEKYQLISESSCVILPSYSENFGNIIAEGMAMGKVVITTTGTPWRVLSDNAFGYWIEPTAEELFLAMKTVYQLTTEDRALMGKGARDFILGHMSWQTKANELVKMFKSCVS